MTDLVDIMAKHNLSVDDVMYVAATTKKTVERWLDDETSDRKPAPTSVIRLLRLVYRDALPEDYRP